MSSARDQPPSSSRRDPDHGVPASDTPPPEPDEKLRSADRPLEDYTSEPIEGDEVDDPSDSG